jgi:hypothetical protein
MEILAKHPWAETRIGCEVCMGLTLSWESGRYKVIDLFLRHNHLLQTLETSHLMSPQQKISEAQACDIEMAYKSWIWPKIAHELVGTYASGTSNLGYTCHDLKNYLWTKRQNELKHGEARSLLQYFQSKVVENSLFWYVIRLGFPIFRKVQITIDLGGFETHRSGFKSK